MRREKRKRLGIVVSPHESDADSVDESQTSVPGPLVNSAALRDARISERQQQVQATRKSKVSPVIYLNQRPICTVCGIGTTLTYQVSSSSVPRSWLAGRNSRRVLGEIVYRAARGMVSIVMFSDSL